MSIPIGHVKGVVCHKTFTLELLNSGCRMFTTTEVRKWWRLWTNVKNQSQRLKHYFKMSNFEGKCKPQNLTQLPSKLIICFDVFRDENM